MILDDFSSGELNESLYDKDKGKWLVGTIGGKDDILYYR